MEEQLLKNYQMAKRRLFQDLSREPMLEEIAAEMGVDVDEIEDIEKRFLKNEDKYKIYFGVSVVLLIIAIITIISLWDKYRSIKETAIIRYSTISEYHNALWKANSSIEELNSIIEEAQGHAWDSYDEMGEALDDLYMIDRIDDPRPYWDSY